MTRKTRILNALPPTPKKWVRRAYYPFWLWRYPETKWPPARHLRSLIGEGDCVVDVGANLGYTTLFFSRWVGGSGRVHAIEPMPETYGQLSWNMRCLRRRNVVAHPVALSDHEGTAYMRVPRDEHGAPNYYECELVTDPAEGDVPIRITTLAALLTPELPIDFLKIDAEGHEAEVLRGAWPLIEHRRPHLLIEFKSDLDDPATTAGRCLTDLRALGYTDYLADVDALRPRAPGEHGVDTLLLASNHPSGVS